ncbi:MAG: 4-hydroxythreonine-4-phosphate dehydrogenase PdxA [Candidatus Omnitrophota bacterium]
MLKNNKVRVGLTIGDPAGIGPTIILKAMERLKDLAEFTVIGDKGVFEKSQKSLPAGESGKVKNIEYKFIDLDNVPRKNFKFGQLKAEYGRASVEYLDKALELIKNDSIDCLTTCPVSKEAIGLSGLKGFSGHTEYLASRVHTKHFAMMLLNSKLKISLVTRHIALKDVARYISIDKIYNTIAITCESLRGLFGIRKPRIIVCGLNPHASDNGLIGDEENRVIKPALARLKKKLKGVCIDGPQAADVAILKAYEGRYDAIIAMYHDQALIPLKICGGYTGVNLTLGFSFVRTSPLHGTAFDIADKYGLANPQSLIEAVRLAVKCTLNQKRA